METALTVLIWIACILLCIPILTFIIELIFTGIVFFIGLFIIRKY